MFDKMDIETALAHLEAGKFSFRMIDAIQTHVRSLESDLTAARDLHAKAIGDLRRQQLVNWRLEAEVKSLNTKVNALFRTNALTEMAIREITPLMAKAGEQLRVAKEQALPEVKILAAKAVRETSPLAKKALAYMPVLKKHIGVTAGKTAAFLSQFRQRLA